MTRSARDVMTGSVGVCDGMISGRSVMTWSVGDM